METETTKEVLEATEWMIENKERYNIRILNISVGMLPSAKKEEKERLIAAMEQGMDTMGSWWSRRLATTARMPAVSPYLGILKTIITVGSSDG